ncbi:hypothetical protein C2S52_010386 [Perilla frutescens var. hirtella]|nr:hypothetical protein C2S52_010386 [Perilla frutescens var. hirtella]
MATSSSSSSATQVNFPSTKLRLDSSREEYDSWKEAMLRVLESNNLVSFIDRKLPLPLETNSQAHKEWKHIDLIVKEWIFDSLSDQLKPIVIARKTAREVWFLLETNFTHPTPSPPSVHQGEDVVYKQMPLALYKAALRGDWDATEAILEQDPELAEARVAPNLDTALHIAVGTGRAIPYLEKLVNYMAPDLLAMKNSYNRTALHMAAVTGNLAAARILVSRRRDLLYVMDTWGQLPVVNAAMCDHPPTVDFFISQTINDDFDRDHYVAQHCLLLLNTLIESEFFDNALNLVERYPDLARMQHASGLSVLRTLSLKDKAFPSGARLNLWERLIYSIEDPSCCTPTLRELGRWHRNLHTVLYQVIRRIVPHVKWIHEQKVKHEQALKLLTCLCSHIESLNEIEAESIYADAMLKAAELGIPEVIEAIVDTCPNAVYSMEVNTKRFFLHMAVENRCEKVFNLVYQMSDHKHQFSNIKDLSGNTLSHLAAKLAPPHKLNLVSGAALQMQRELQWFREVEKNVRPYDRERPNSDEKTPRMIFTEEHSSLKAEGEKWMKDTANSCSIAAALIATVVFAAAITVPGGNGESGYPLFARSSAFIIFAISDALSLFTSSTSLLMFLAILTSRYAEEDFLYALPKRLCIGLFTLFLSILSMMAAFSATIYLVFGRKSAWVLIPVAVFACLPVTSFVLLQFPLLVDVISSTYGRGIFGKQSDRPFH